MLGSSRVAVAVGALLLGFLAVLAATQPPRASRELRRLELADLIEAEDARVRALRAELRDLRGELAAAQEQAGVAGGRVERLRERIDDLAAPAGIAPLEAPGVVVTLDDSSSARSPTGDPNDLLIHEQDIQAVVNALWAAGATAVAVDGERLASTSAVRCAGNTLLLHGTVHSPPYEVAAAGDPEGLAAAVGRQPGMARLLSAVDSFGLGYRVETALVSMAGAPAAVARVAAPGSVA